MAVQQQKDSISASKIQAKPCIQKTDTQTSLKKTPSLKLCGYHFFDCFWKRLWHCVTLLICAMMLVFSCFGYILWKFGGGLPDYHFLKDYQPASITFMYDRTGQLLKTLAVEKREYIHLSDVPPRLIQAFIAAEDKNFFAHRGIDMFGLIRAILTNTFAKKWKHAPIGASTITQQVAKIFLVGNKRNFVRKIKEAILAFRLEKALNKDRILELYLNQIYMGNGGYGVVIAAKHYFEKSLRNLTLSECAFLASLPKAPTQYDPFKNSKKAIKRRNWVLERMYRNGIISAKNFHKAKNEPLRIFKPVKHPEENNYFIEEARRELIHNFGENHTYSAGLEATLSLDRHLQKLLDQSLRFGLEKFDQSQPWQGIIKKIPLHQWSQHLKSLPSLKLTDIPAKYAVILKTNPLIIGLENGDTAPLSINRESFQARPGDVILVKKNHSDSFTPFQIPKLTGGAVVLDALTGEILALSGGYSYKLNQFNCATQAWRQPASAFKPFVYLTALQRGWHEDSKIREKPISFRIAGGGSYAPHNYNKNSYGGLMTLKEGLIQSRNVLTVILANKIGIRNVIKTAQDFGISDRIPSDITVALGTAETTVLKLASAYAAIFNGGFYIQPTLFQNITSHIYPEKFQLKSRIKKKVILNEDHITQMKHMLSGAVLYGTGKSIALTSKKLPINIYGKTGTSSNFKDAWFICCIEPTENTSDGLLKKGRPLIIAVFMGYPVPQSMGEHQSGSKVALPVVRYFLEQIQA